MESRISIARTIANLAVRLHADWTRRAGSGSGTADRSDRLRKRYRPERDMGVYESQSVLQFRAIGIDISIGIWHAPSAGRMTSTSAAHLPVSGFPFPIF